MNLKNKVGIIEYGAGNLASICNAIDFLNFDVKLISNPNDIKKLFPSCTSRCWAFWKIIEKFKQKRMA